jgi:hypothetical protein
MFKYVSSVCLVIFLNFLVFVSSLFTLFFADYFGILFRIYFICFNFYFYVNIQIKKFFFNFGEFTFFDLCLNFKKSIFYVLKNSFFLFIIIFVWGMTRNCCFNSVKTINALVLCDSDSGQLVTAAAGTVTTLGYVMGGGLVLGAGLCGLGIVSGVLLLIRNRAIFFDSLHPKGIVQTGLAKEKADPSLVPPVSIKREDWKPTATVPEHFETAEEAAQNPDSGPGDFYEKFCRFLSYNFPEGEKAWAFFLKHLNYSSGWYSNFDEFIPWLDEQFIKLGTSGFYSVYVYWLWGGSIGLPITFGLFVQIALKCLWHFKVWGFFYSSIFISYRPLIAFPYTNCKFLDL